MLRRGLHWFRRLARLYSSSRHDVGVIVVDNHRYRSTSWFYMLPGSIKLPSVLVNHICSWFSLFHHMTWLPLLLNGVVDTHWLVGVELSQVDVGVSVVVESSLVVLLLLVALNIVIVTARVNS